LNLLTGWLVIGWIIALAMACGANPPRHEEYDGEECEAEERAAY
jgi:hypothetical protein